MWLLTGVGPISSRGDSLTWGTCELRAASAFSIIIFVLVAVISYLSFRQTKVLEELN